MAKEALEEEFSFPDGGIADFYMEDDEIAALEKEEAKKQFGSEGIANFQEVAARMSSYGRGGDDTIAHLATGEIVIPLPLIDNNPEMKASIFKHLEELGIENPEQYVVGSPANSINPETGLAEFGWLKKAFKKVTRAVKKGVKSVVKLVKKAAPIILPFVLGPAGLGLSSIYAGALGAGIGTLVQGGSLKDAFKSALVGGATGAVFSGFQGSGSFGDNIANSLKTPFVEGSYLANTFGSGAQSAATTAPLSVEGSTSAAVSEPPTGADAIKNQSSELVSRATDITAPQPQLSSANAVTTMPSSYGGDPMLFAGGTDPAAGTYSNLALSGTPVSSAPYQVPSALESAKNIVTGGGDGRFAAAKDLFMPAGPTQSDIITRAGQLQQQAAAQNLTLSGTEAMAAATKELTPGIIRTFGPAAAAAGVGLYASGAFDVPEVPEPEQGPTGMDLLKQDREKYGFNEETPRRADGTYLVASDYAMNPAYIPAGGNPFYYGSRYAQQYAAEGGEIFPRRIGGIMPDEGIPGKDSVRAMLMPGEFVMTTDAVKGLGNGNAAQGINNMYQMMRGLEARGRGVA